MGDVGNLIITARRAEAEDAAKVELLVQSETRMLFERYNILHLIEHSILSITLEGSNGEIIAFGTFNDTPNVERLYNWLDTFEKHFSLPRCDPINTIFFNFFVAKDGFSHGAVKEVVRTMFNAIIDVHYAFLFVPTGVFPESGVAEVFEPVPPLPDKPTLDGYVLFSCCRHTHQPVLYVREARVEDSDDLEPIFNKHTDLLRRCYGDYFFAELVESVNEHMKCLVAEVNGTAIGFMSISDVVDYELLNGCFELLPFHGLRDAHAADDLLPPVAKQRLASGERASTLYPVSERQPPSSAEPDHDAASVFDSVAPADTAATGRKETLPSYSREATHTSLPTISISPEKDHRFSYHSPLPLIDENFVPKYYGDCAAVAIQLFCIDDQYETRSLDFMAKVFELFPSKHFCIITIPHLVPEFPLLHYFTRASPRPFSTLSQELYIFHKHGLLRSFSVRKSLPTDIRRIADMTIYMDSNEQLLNDLRNYISIQRDANTVSPLSSFTAVCCDQVVGVCILQQADDIEYIRAHYNLEEFIYYAHYKRDAHAHLAHFVLMPQLGNLSRHFLKEVMRLSRHSCLYYSVCGGAADERRHLTALFDAFVPVRPRRQVQYAFDVLKHNRPADKLLVGRQPFALFHFNIKLVMEPKVTINARVVVIGASDTAMAFLQTIVFCPHLKFNNLTLISPHGLPGDRPLLNVADSLNCTHMFANHLYYNEDDYAKLWLRSFVNVVSGKMTSIDRNMKRIEVDGQWEYYYDHLVLTTGQQYTSIDRPDSSELLSAPNSFTINDAVDSELALLWLQQNLAQRDGAIVLYGETIDSYCALAVLMEMLRLSDEQLVERIVFVIPATNNQQDSFDDEKITAMVTSALDSNNVSIYLGYSIDDYRLDADGLVDKLFLIGGESGHSAISIDVMALFCYHRKMIDRDAFTAINNACLIFDGRLVIDSMFHTNDIAIRAAGPLTKYQRKYYADHVVHELYSSMEVGAQLARCMLLLFDPASSPAPQQPPASAYTVLPDLRSPLVLAAVLPGRFHFLRITKPGPSESRAAAEARHDFGQLVSTGSVYSADWFEIHLNAYESVESIVCFRNQPLPMTDYVQLYGMHQRFMNNMLSRYKEGLISNLYAFLAESWAVALFHDRFVDLRQEIRQLMALRITPDAPSVAETVEALVNEDLTLTGAQKQQLKDDFDLSNCKKLIKQHILEHLDFNSYHLPMYAKPGMI